MSWSGYLPGDLAVKADTDYWTESLRQAHQDAERERNIDALERVIKLLKANSSKRGAWHLHNLLTEFKVNYSLDRLVGYE